MTKIVAFAGSNSNNSINKQLAVYAASLVKDVSIDTIDLNDFDMPIFGIDEEQENGFPKAAILFNELLKNYDGFVLSLAEHNGSYAAVFKNIFDWVSRIDRKVFKDKPVLLMATSPGGRGGATVLNAAANTFPHLGAAEVIPFSLPNFYDNFKDNELSGEYRSQLNVAVDKFQEVL